MSAFVRFSFSSLYLCLCFSSIYLFFSIFLSYLFSSLLFICGFVCLLCLSFLSIFFSYLGLISFLYLRLCFLTYALSVSFSFTYLSYLILFLCLSKRQFLFNPIFSFYLYLCFALMSNEVLGMVCDSSNSLLILPVSFFHDHKSKKHFTINFLHIFYKHRAG